MRIALVLVLVSGCSLIGTRAPNANDSRQTCNTSEVSPALDTAWVIVGALSLLSVAADDYNSNKAEAMVPIGLFTAAFAGSAAYGFSNVGKCRRRAKEIMAEDAEDQRRLARRPPASSRDDAWQMTKQAQLAARNGDCDTVIALQQVVYGMDAEFHRAVFMRDPSIIACMTQREIPIEPPSATPPTTLPAQAPPAPRPVQAPAGTAAPAPPAVPAPPPTPAPAPPPPAASSPRSP